MANIFINYRRSDAEGDAGRLRNELTRLLDVRPFMDVDSLSPGEDFVEALDKALESCSVMLVVIGKSWLTADAEGRRRLDDPQDFVRLEIATALERKIKVVPVLVQGATMPVEAELPQPLKALARRHAAELRHSRYGDDVNHLASELKNTIRPGSETDNGKPSSGDAGLQQKETSVEPFAGERKIATWTAVGIVAVVVYLVVRNEPFADPNLVVLFRTILSLGVGVLAATIPGFLAIGYHRGGLSLRAGGALAMFVLTYFGTPEVSGLNLKPKSPVVELDRVKQIDFRTAASPEKPDEERGRGTTYVTVPMSLRSTEQSAANVFVDETSVRFSGEAGKTHEFRWRYFVTMNEERFGVWLGLDEDAHPFALEAGTATFKEILHTPNSGLQWSDFVEFLANSTGSVLDVEVVAKFADKSLTQSCRIDLEKWRTQLLAYRQRSSKLPGRITMDCIER